MLKTATLSSVAAAVIVADWLRLEEPRHLTFVFVVALAAAIVAASLRPAWIRASAAAVAFVVGISVAFDAWPNHASWVVTIGDRFGSAFLDFYEFRLPIDPSIHERMHMLLLCAAFAFTLLTGLAVAARRPILAVGAFLIGAGWPATLLAGGHELTRGALILAAALVLLSGLSGRATHIALPASATVVLAAIALSASPAVAKPGFLDWQHWNPYVRPVKPVSVSYVWDAQYTRLQFPRKVTTVLSIRAPEDIGTYWRATVLDSFNVDRWMQGVWRETDLERNELIPPQAFDTGTSVEQEITVDALADRHLIAASIPVAYNISEPASYLGQDVAEARDGLHRGQRYIAWSYIAEPTPEQLVASPASYPRALTRRGRDLDIDGVTAPAFGTPNRDAILERRLTASERVPYAQLLQRARAVAGHTRSPYAAVVALERYLRTTGGFTYSTDPPLTPGLAPLVGFVLQTKSGYCQHFAGAMALMARLLGIPARVAVGFVRGQYNDGEWEVTDHDAHAWVEVWFKGYGWLPFDPTPGRGRLAASYTSASKRFDVSAEARLFSRVVKGGEVFGALTKGDDTTPRRGTSLRSAADVGVRGLTPVARNGRSHSLALFLLLLTLGLVGVIAGLKAICRWHRYVTRDPRRVATACGRELLDFLVDQRYAVTRNATLRELADVVYERLAVDAERFVTAAERARFGPPDESRDAARLARGELRDLKRRLRRELFVLDRARGLVSLRSLGFA